MSGKEDVKMLIRFTTLLPIVAICLIFLAPTAIFSCAMSAIISMDGINLAEIIPSGSHLEYAQYNDPYDYFAFIMSNSSFNGNNDGYGIAYYAQDQKTIPNDQMWFKRVTCTENFGRKFYEGNYFDETVESDILDEAIANIMSIRNRPHIIMSHARNASAQTLGNHPFYFNDNGRTYTFMHNGNCQRLTADMINIVQAMPGYADWFTAHPSNYFNSSEPLTWVDTEVFFRFIMANIKLYNYDTLSGIIVALKRFETSLREVSVVANFIMSDGTNVYAFRNTPITGNGSNYRLSYRCVNGQFWGIRTQYPIPGDYVIDQHQLVIFGGNNKPRVIKNVFDEYNNNRQYQQIPYHNETGSIAFDHHGFYPNPFNNGTQIIFDNNNDKPDKITIFNIRGQKIKQLSSLSSGEKSTWYWDGTDLHKENVPNGLYFAVIESHAKKNKVKIIYRLH